MKHSKSSGRLKKGKAGIYNCTLRRANDLRRKMAIMRVEILQEKIKEKRDSKDAGTS